MKIKVFLSRTGRPADGECTPEIFSVLTAKDSYTSADGGMELSKSADIE